MLLRLRLPGGRQYGHDDDFRMNRYTPIDEGQVGLCIIFSAPLD
jgi:hypothetical protein